MMDEAEQSAREEAASKLFSGPVDFLLSAPQLKFLPDPVVPEIAFCGRSNVGKSSLLEAGLLPRLRRRKPWALTWFTLAWWLRSIS